MIRNSKKCLSISCLFFFLKLDAQITYNQYSFSEDIKKKIELDTTTWKYQTGAVAFSFILDQTNVLQTWEKGFLPRVYQPLKRDSTLIANSKIISAKEYIISKAKEEQIIIINEAHHLGLHRSFTQSLLKELYSQGYRYLGLEALEDDILNTRNHATTLSGYYIQEPTFGNLIFEAKKLGFTIFGYEASPEKNGKEREIEQAKNIQNFLKVNSLGKCIIHCGFDHAFESEVAGWEKAMAGRLKEYMNLNPFTIDQVRFTEKSKPEFSHFFTYATGRTEPFVILGEKNVVFNGFTEPKQTDIVVIHPTTNYTNGRPNWFIRDKQSYKLTNEILKNLTLPTQVLAFRKDEYEKGGIPADYIEIHDLNTPTFLYLRSGNYELIFRNKNYEVEKTWLITVKDEN